MKVLVTGVVVLVAAHGAHAGDDARFATKDVVTLEIDQCTPDKNVTKEELLRRGADYYQRGEVLYLQGDYPGAVQELVESYCEVPFYSILKDIGQAYERQLEYGRAIAYFSRYVLDVPADAKRSNSCATDPQEDKQNVIARIQVLEKLPAKIRVQATPSDAHVSLVQDSVVKARGSSGDELVVPGGPYQLVVDHDGFHTSTRDIHPEIGKPYTYFETLNPVKGHLKVQAVPGDARIFLDNRLVATGIYDVEVQGAKYHLSIEAQDHETVTKDIEVVPDKDTNLSIELPHEPEFGRKQLLVYGTLTGGVAAGLIAGGQSDPTLISLSTIGGLGAGFFGRVLRYAAQPRARNVVADRDVLADRWCRRRRARGDREQWQRRYLRAADRQWARDRWRRRISRRRCDAPDAGRCRGDQLRRALGHRRRWFVRTQLRSRPADRSRARALGSRHGHGRWRVVAAVLHRESRSRGADRREWHRRRRARSRLGELDRASGQQQGHFDPRAHRELRARRLDRRPGARRHLHANDRRSEARRHADDQQVPSAGGTTATTIGIAGAF